MSCWGWGPATDVDRVTLRNALVALAFVSFVLGMFATNAVAGESFVAPDKPWWARSALARGTGSG